jgi:hypothetical protein
MGPPPGWEQQAVTTLAPEDLEAMLQVAMQGGWDGTPLVAALQAEIARRQNAAPAVAEPVPAGMPGVDPVRLAAFRARVARGAGGAGPKAGSTPRILDKDPARRDRRGMTTTAYSQGDTVTLAADDNDPEANDGRGLDIPAGSQVRITGQPTDPSHDEQGKVYYPASFQGQEVLVDAEKLQGGGGAPPTLASARVTSADYAPAGDTPGIGVFDPASHCSACQGSGLVMGERGEEECSECLGSGRREDQLANAGQGAGPALAAVQSTAAEIHAIAAGAAVAPSIRILRQRYLPEDVYEGDVAYRDTEDEVHTYDPAEHGDDPVEWAHGLVSGEGLVSEEGTHWFPHPDGGYDTDYSTGERLEPSAHPEGFTDEQLAALHQRLRLR